jgi:hypothetical protein
MLSSYVSDQRVQRRETLRASYSGRQRCWRNPNRGGTCCPFQMRRDKLPQQQSWCEYPKKSRPKKQKCCATSPKVTIRFAPERKGTSARPRNTTARRDTATLPNQSPLSSTSCRRPQRAASPSGTDDQETARLRRSGETFIGVRDVSYDAINQRIRTGHKRLLGQAHTRIIEDPQAEVFVRCDDVDGIYRRLLHAH